MTNTRRIQILVGLLPMILIAALPLGGWGRRYLGLGDLWGGEAPFWILTAALLIYVALVERRPFSSIGFRAPGIVDLLLGIGTGIAASFAIVAIYFLVFPLLHLHMNTSVMSRFLRAPFFFRFMLVTRAAVSEELIFRGYGIERITELSGSRWLAALVTLAAFVIAHLGGWGPAQLLAVLPAGILLTALYLWRRNLWANMLAHWVADAMGFLAPH